ncbi:IS110 family transposase [Staphylococcus aureus]|uniref:IS110 family transposase n=1 Tax=Staphylococcus aureus TaxID=1280 RepID=UPI00139B6846|nr:IS110 family transposase [Staphylococcus aureus]NDR49878.1 IS110 family transposase [Staphylococcus aureus]NDR52295.1 IS110 family transposase [Staphylococcus aureus]HDK3087168.1 IS110 family transposase [Staphylococcus aureus]
MKLFVGLDVSSDKLDACFLTDTLTILHQGSYANDIEGATQIKETIVNMFEQFAFDKVVIGMESTSMYSAHPLIFFHEDEDLKNMHCVVTIEDPFKIHNYAKVFNADKTDTNDAFFIADFLRSERYSHSPLKEEQFLSLQQLTRSRMQLVNMLVETKQHFIENLYYKCNTLSRELRDEESLSTTVFSTSIIELITSDMGLDEIAQLPLNKLAETLQTLGRGRFKHPEKLAKTIQKAIRSSYRLSPTFETSIDIVLATLVGQMRSLEASIKQLEKGIERIVKAMPEYQCLTSIPGVGLVYAAGIIAEVGQIERFENQAKLAKYAGLHWKKSESGNYKSENTPLTKRGNRYLRYYLIEAANSVRRHLPEYNEFYRKKYQETPKHQHKRAIVLTARKFVRLVDTLLRNHQLYTSPRSVES